jgi:tryptophan 2,3-dioxygenase
MTNKFTHKEFIERHVEFLKNYSTKYLFQDLDFKSVMFMNGCKDDEFREHMDKMWRNKEQNDHLKDEIHTPIIDDVIHKGWRKNQVEDWGDEEDDGDEQSSSGGVYGRDYGDEDDGGDDSNEY